MDFTGLSGEVVRQVVSIAGAILAVVLLWQVWKRSIPLLISILFTFGVVIYSIQNPDWVVNAVGWMIQKVT